MFDSRTTATEFLDRPGCDPALTAASYRFVETINSCFQKAAFAQQPAEPYDCAVASMCFHRFSNSQILTLLQRLRSFRTKDLKSLYRLLH